MALLQQHSIMSSKVVYCVLILIVLQYEKCNIQCAETNQVLLTAVFPLKQQQFKYFCQSELKHESNQIKYQIKVFASARTLTFDLVFYKVPLRVQSHHLTIITGTFDQQQVNIYKCVFSEQEPAELFFCYQAAAQTLISSFTVQGL